jgi:hypothetical protein
MMIRFEIEGGLFLELVKFRDWRLLLPIVTILR